MPNIAGTSWAPAKELFDGLAAQQSRRNVDGREISHSRLTAELSGSINREAIDLSA
jgi:hypothetical protein